MSERVRARVGDPEVPRRVTPRMLTEPRRPARIRALHAAPWLAVGTVCVGAFMGQLDASIVTTALPVMRTNLHASIAGVEWVVLVYVLVLAGTVAAVGKIADRVGRKLLYTYGFAIFVAGSAACSLAPSLGLLVVGRLVQAIGAVMLQANSYALIRDVLPASRLGTGLGVQGAAQAVGLSVGPALGGALTALGGWRLIFLVNIPIGLVGLALGWFFLPRSTHRDPESRIDPAGTLLLAAIPAAALAALSLAAQSGTPGWTEPALIALAAILVIAAVARQRRTPGSVVDASLLRIPTFVAGVVAALLSYVVLFGCLVAVPFFLEKSLHVGPAAAGLELSALPVSLAVVAPFGGAIRDRIGPRVPAGAGMILTAAGMALLAASATRAGLTVVGLAVAGAGMGLFVAANNAATMFAAPRQRAGSAGGLLNMARGLGTALGVALTSLVFASGRGFTSAAGLLLVVAILAAVISVTWSGSADRVRSPV
ncbi:MAG TPA: MFS transporter [Candidatus Saccharimonadales bacterium]|nr:MFS transporter [Candidatus Saccharimonadales bacterium]